MRNPQYKYLNSYGRICEPNGNIRRFMIFLTIAIAAFGLLNWIGG